MAPLRSTSRENNERTKEEREIKRRANKITGSKEMNTFGDKNSRFEMINRIWRGGDYRFNDSFGAQGIVVCKEVDYASGHRGIFLWYCRCRVLSCKSLVACCWQRQSRYAAYILTYLLTYLETFLHTLYRL